MVKCQINIAKWSNATLTPHSGAQKLDDVGMPKAGEIEDLGFQIFLLEFGGVFLHALHGDLPPKCVHMLGHIRSWPGWKTDMGFIIIIIIIIHLSGINMVWLSAENRNGFYYLAITSSDLMLETEMGFIIWQ